LFHADGRTGLTKLIVAFRNFANARENEKLIQLCAKLRKGRHTKLMFAKLIRKSDLQRRYMTKVPRI
jgi:hypothetical protein